jgi:5-bromo-4-chloroindolyl phosphate hydrolysis protein
MEYRSGAPRYIRKPVSTHGMFLFLLPLPLLAVVIRSVFSGNTSDLVYGLVASLLYFYGAWITRRGLSIEKEYKRRKISVPPTLPRKLIGACLFGAATFIVSKFIRNHDFLFASIMGFGALAGVLLAYGKDPSKEKSAKNVPDGYTTGDVVAAIEEAEVKIVDIENARRQIRNLEMKKHLHTITGQAREILGIIEEDPKDLRKARKFLHTYLTGAKRVTEGYVKATRHAHNDELSSNFREVLENIETVFAEQKQKLIDNDVLDVDIQIEVLNTRLEKEGV